MVDDTITGMTIKVACKIKDLQTEIAKAWHNAKHPKH